MNRSDFIKSLGLGVGGLYYPKLRLSDDAADLYRGIKK